MPVPFGVDPTWSVADAMYYMMKTLFVGAFLMGDLGVESIQVATLDSDFKRFYNICSLITR